MNKKVILGMLAAAGMLLATSCTQDELNVAQLGNEAQVTFSLGLEGGHATRAISDGSGVDKLVYAVYKLSTGDNAVYELQPAVGSTSTESQFVKDDFKSGDKVSIPLAKGQTYRVAFWAQDSDCDAYNTADLTAVGVTYANDDVNNDETRDAFFKTVEFTVEGNKTIDVVLTRPFAQVNVGVTAEDWEAAVASGIEIEKSAVTIDNAATTINLLTGEVSGEQAVTYALNVIPDEPLEVETDDTKDGKEQYHWLSMSYILVSETSGQDADQDGTLGDARTTLESLAYTFAPESGNDITFAEGLNSVPVQRNWRTNILGKILTGDIEFNITVDPAYDGDIIYPDGSLAQELEFAATFGGSVKLTDDVKLEVPLVVGADMILDLNGHTITGDWDKSKGAVIKNNANLTIANGTVKSTGANGGSAIANNGTLTADNVTLNGAPNDGGGWPAYTVNNTGTMTISNSNITSNHGAVCSYATDAVITMNNTNIEMSGIAGFTSHGIYTYDGGKVIVNGGNIANNATDQNATGASVINGTVEVTAGNFTGRIENYYGTPVLKGGNYSVEPKAAFIASGYEAVKSGDKWYVVANDVTVAATLDEVKNVFASGGKVVLADDIEFEKITPVEAGKEVYLDLNGKTITVDENTTSNTLIWVKDGGKLTIDGNGTIDLGSVSTMAIFCPYGELVINNGTFIRDKFTTVPDNATGLFLGSGSAQKNMNVTINGGYFDGGYYNADAADIEEILAGTKTLTETADDIAKRDKPGDANLVRVAVKDNVTALLNHSGYGSFKVYGGTFVGANPAWGDEGCMLPTTPNYLRPWSYYQGAMLDGQTFNENGLVLPAGYEITKGTHADGRPTYTVTYNK